jgi:hypothetical protein
MPRRWKEKGAGPVPDANPCRRARQIETQRRQFAQGDAPTFASVAPAERVERALAQERVSWREKVYTSAPTLWAFLSQVADPDGSCRAGQMLSWVRASRRNAIHFGAGRPVVGRMLAGPKARPASERPCRRAGNW